jgi:hypothetical protein
VRTGVNVTNIKLKILAVSNGFETRLHSAKRAKTKINTITGKLKLLITTLATKGFIILVIQLNRNFREFE